MTNDGIGKVKNIVKDLENKSLQAEVISAQSINPISELKQTLAGFIRYRISKIQETDILKSKVTDKLAEMVDADLLKPDQIVRLYKIMESEQSTAVEGLFSLFKPVPNTTSALLERREEEDKDNFEKMYENMTPQQMQQVDKFMRVFLALTGSSEEN